MPCGGPDVGPPTPVKPIGAPLVPGLRTVGTQTRRLVPMGRIFSGYRDRPSQGPPPQIDWHGLGSPV